MSVNDMNPGADKTSEEPINYDAGRPGAEAGAAAEIQGTVEIDQRTEHGHKAKESSGLTKHEHKEVEFDQRTEHEHHAEESGERTEHEQRAAEQERRATESEQRTEHEQETAEKEQSEQPKPQTREVLKEKQQDKERTKKRVKVRLIPIWLRLVIIVLLLAASLTAGAMVGYGVIGDGNPFDVLKQSTWTHIIDLINKE